MPDTRSPMGRHELANLLRASLEGHNPPTQDDNEEQNPPALNSDGLLLGLAHALKINLPSTDDTNDDSL